MGKSEVDQGVEKNSNVLSPSVFRRVLYYSHSFFVHDFCFHQRCNRIAYPSLTVPYLHLLSRYLPHPVNQPSHKSLTHHRTHLTIRSNQTWSRRLYTQHDLLKPISRNLINRPLPATHYIDNMLVRNVTQRDELVPPAISTKFVVTFKFYAEAGCCIAGCVQIRSGLRVTRQGVRDPEAPVRGEEGGVEDDEVDWSGHILLFNDECGRIGVEAVFGGFCWQARGCAALMHCAAPAISVAYLNVLDVLGISVVLVYKQDA